MPDPIETLSRFTPEAATLQRDELFFAAGRASAPKRTWLFVLAGLLTLTQTATLIGWRTRPATPNTPVEVVPTPAATPTPTVSEPSEFEPHSLARARQLLQQTGDWAIETSVSEHTTPEHKPLAVGSKIWE